MSATCGCVSRGGRTTASSASASSFPSPMTSRHLVPRTGPTASNETPAGSLSATAPGGSADTTTSPAWRPPTPAISGVDTTWGRSARSSPTPTRTNLPDVIHAPLASSVAAAARNAIAVSRLPATAAAPAARRFSKTVSPSSVVPSVTSGRSGSATLTASANNCSVIARLGRTHPSPTARNGGSGRGAASVNRRATWREPTRSPSTSGVGPARRTSRSAVRTRSAPSTSAATRKPSSVTARSSSGMRKPAPGRRLRWRVRRRRSSVATTPAARSPPPTNSAAVIRLGKRSVTVWAIRQPSGVLAAACGCACPSGTTCISTDDCESGADDGAWAVGGCGVATTAASNPTASAGMVSSSPA